MLISKEVALKWNPRIKKHYTDMGYVFTKMGDSFLVKVSDLTQGSNVDVDVKCDYCGKIFSVAWYHRVKSVKCLDKDCCSSKDCTTKKSQEVLYTKYGVTNAMEIDGVKDKIKDTVNKKYGCDCVFANDQVKSKIKTSNLLKYGTEYAVRSELVQNKTKETCMVKYGVPCYLNLDYSGEKNSGENNPAWKGGINYHHIERCTFENYEWRKRIFEKYHFTCQKCGKVGSEINAHHIFNWRDYPDLRYDDSNGIVFCKECHIKFHSIYGKRNNTDIQLNEFLNSNKD